MKFPDLISVLIPTYNVEKFVYDAVMSILNQSYSNLEIIIVDDSSTDKTYEILQSISILDNRVRLFRNKTNLKIAATLNFALKQATGKYIARMDGDDFSERTRIESQYIFLKNNPEFVLVGNNYILEDELGNEISRTNYLSDFKILKKCMRYESPVAHIWLTKKNIYDEIGDYRMPGVEDYDFLLRLVSKGYKITNLKDYLYKVKLRNGNTISTMGLKQRKAFAYAFKLYNMRCENGIDSYSDFAFSVATAVTNTERNNFMKSSEYLNLFLKNKKKSKFKSLYFLLMTIYSSPKAQLKYLFNRMMLKTLKRCSAKFFLKEVTE